MAAGGEGEKTRSDTSAMVVRWGLLGQGKGQDGGLEIDRRRGMEGIPYHLSAVA